MTIGPGTRVGPYEVTALVGEGGMGKVWRARHTSLKRDDALKVLPEAFAADPERLARFQREAQVLASLNHPNIARVYGLEEVDGIRALVMELVDGPTLAERIGAGPLPVDEALRIAKQIAEALEAAHEQGIVHRDLKPANVKVRADGTVKVLDFGLAKAIEPIVSTSAGATASPTMTSPAMTGMGIILGTAAYMAPEQARGLKTDTRADIWAFGVLLWEMLTGEQLFQGETVTDVLAAVVTKAPDLSRTPLVVQRLLRRCLEKDPKRRLRHIGEVPFLIDDVAPTSREQHPRPLVARLPWAVAALCLLAFSALALVYLRETPPEQPLTQFSVDLGPGAVAGARVTASISPDGRRLAFIARGADGRPQLATRLLDQAGSTLLSGTEDATDPFFSPDSQWLGFFAGGKMKKISVQGGAIVTLCDAADARGASWGEDGYIVATLSAVSGVGLSRVPDSGGVPQTLTTPDEMGDASHRWPQVLPDGQGVLFTATRVTGDYDNGTIKILSSKTGQVSTVAQGGYFGRYLGTSPGTGVLVYVRQGTLLGVPFDPGRLEARGTAVPLLEDLAPETPSAAGQFDVSLGGTLIYLSGKTTRTWSLEWLDRAGKREPFGVAPGLYYSPRLSPNGKRLTYSANLKDIFVYEWEGRRTTQLTFADKDQVNSMPIWAPDGTHLVFRTGSPAGFSLQWIRSDGAGEPQRLIESPTDLRPYSFSPDGSRLAFAQGSPDGFDLFTATLNLTDQEHPKAGKPELFLRVPRSDEFESAFSPDGRWIAYRSNGQGRIEIFVQPFPSSSGGKWLIGTGRHPVWSRNGRELFYFGPDNRIMVAGYAARGNSFAAETPRVWSDTQILEPHLQFWNIDLAPDGRRFVVSPRPEELAGGRGVQVTVLLNFFDEVRRRVADR